MSLVSDEHGPVFICPYCRSTYFGHGTADAVDCKGCGRTWPRLGNFYVVYQPPAPSPAAPTKVPIRWGEVARGLLLLAGAAFAFACASLWEAGLGLRWWESVGAMIGSAACLLTGGVTILRGLAGER